MTNSNHKAYKKATADLYEYVLHPLSQMKNRTAGVLFIPEINIMNF